MSYLNSCGYSVQSQFRALFRSSNFSEGLNSLGYSVQSQFKTSFKPHYIFRHIIHSAIAFNRNSQRYYVSTLLMHIIHIGIAFNRNSCRDYMHYFLKVYNSGCYSVKSQFTASLYTFILGLICNLPRYSVQSQFKPI